MITLKEAVTGLYAAWRLLLRDRDAANLLDDSVAGVVKSFFCALIVLPAHIFFVLLSTTAPEGSDAGRLILVNLIAYVIDWIAWPLVMAYLAPALQRDDEYCRYIVAYNWSAGPKYLMFLVIATIFAAGVISKPVFNFFAFVVFVVVLFYDLFIIRVVLRVSVATGVGLLIAATALSMVITIVQSGILA